jgi:proteic killer suppression protein
MLDVTHNKRVTLGSVVVSFRDKRTRDFAAGKRVKAFSGIERSARLKLDRLEAAFVLRDLAALPGNHFERLKGDRQGRYSVRINEQWRICFDWLDDAAGPSRVEIVDYH